MGLHRGMHLPACWRVPYDMYACELMRGGSERSTLDAVLVANNSDSTTGVCLRKTISAVVFALTLQPQGRTREDLPSRS